MHKRKKRKYGVFYIIIALILIFFAAHAHKANAGENANASPVVRLKSSAIFDITAGFINYYKGNYPAAVNYFKRESGNIFKNRYYDYTISLLYYKKGEYKKSLKYLNSALNLYQKINGNAKPPKTKIKYLFLKAKIAANLHNLKMSVKILKRILKSNPYSQRAILLLSDIYIYKNDLKTAIFYLNIIKLNYPGNINSYYLLSKIYSVQNKNDKAEKNLKKIIKLDPYFKKAYFRLAAIYILAGKEKKAIKVFDDYLKIDPYSKTAIYQSAILEYTIKNYQASRKLFLNFINIAKNSKNNFRLINNAYFFTGISYILQKNYKRGLFYLNKLKPGRHYIDAKLQEIEIYIGRYKKTGNVKYGKYIRTAVSNMLSNPGIKKNLKLYYFSAIACEEIKDYKMSEYVIKKGLLKFPNNTSLLYELGSIYHLLKKDTAANLVMKKILKINPYDADALNYVGYELAVKNKNLKKSEEILKKALSYDKGSPFIIDSLGFAYYMEKQYAKALKLFKTALKKLGKSATVLKHAGMDYFMLKRYKKALKYFEKSYKIKKTAEVKKYIAIIKNMKL